MKNLLFPKVFRLIGWILFIPAIVMAVLLYCEVLSFAGTAEIIINDAVIIGAALGAIFIVCSKEACEDEMTRALRLSALLNSLYVYVILLIACTLFVNGLAFLQFMFVNLILFPVIYVLIFSLEMNRFKRMCENEEQN